MMHHHSKYCLTKRREMNFFPMECCSKWGLTYIFQINWWCLSIDGLKWTRIVLIRRDVTIRISTIILWSICLLLEEMKSIQFSPSNSTKQYASMQRKTKAYQWWRRRRRSRCNRCLLRIDIGSRWCSQYRWTTIQCQWLNKLNSWWWILECCCSGKNLSSCSCWLGFHCFQLCNKMIGWMKIFACFTHTFAFDIIHTNSDKTISIKWTMCLRMCIGTCFCSVQTLSMLKICTYLERKSKASWRERQSQTCEKIHIHI